MESEIGKIKVSEVDQKNMHGVQVLVLFLQFTTIVPFGLRFSMCRITQFLKIESNFEHE